MTLHLQVPVIETLSNHAVVLAYVVLLQSWIIPFLRKGNWFYWLMFGNMVCSMTYYLATTLLNLFHDSASDQVILKLIENPTVDRLQDLPNTMEDAIEHVNRWGRYVYHIAFMASACALPIQVCATVLRLKTIVSNLVRKICVILIVLAAACGLSQSILWLMFVAGLMPDLDAQIASVAIDGLMFVMIFYGDFLFLHTVHKKRSQEQAEKESLRSRALAVDMKWYRHKNASYNRRNGLPEATCQNDSSASKQVHSWNEQSESRGAQFIKRIRRKVARGWNRFVGRFTGVNRPMIWVAALLLSHLAIIALDASKIYCFTPLTAEEELVERCLPSSWEITQVFNMLLPIQAFLLLKVNETLKGWPNFHHVKKPSNGVFPCCPAHNT